MEKIELLKQTTLFNSLTDAELEKVTNHCEEITYEIGQLVFGENKIGRGLYIVAEGEVLISSETVTDDELSTTANPFVTIFGAGECFGEVSLLDGGVHSATAKAMSDTKLLVLSEENFEKLADEDKHIGFVIVKNISILLCQRLRNTNVMLRYNTTWGK